MKWGCTFRTIALVRMRISEKMERYGRGGTKLNRMQLKRTGNSKKIRWTDGNKSNSPYLRGKFLVVGANLVLWSNKTMKLKLRRETTRTRIHFVHRTGTGGQARGLTQRVFFSWNCYVYPHLDKTPDFILDIKMCLHVTHILFGVGIGQSVNIFIYPI